MKYPFPCVTIFCMVFPGPTITFYSCCGEKTITFLETRGEQLHTLLSGAVVCCYSESIYQFEGKAATLNILYFKRVIQDILVLKKN